MDAQTVEQYLDRIGFDGEVSQTLECLEELQRAHLTSVPFENLHVFHRLGVQTSTEWSGPKILDEGRGGWCFELNGAFAALLEALGFAVTRLGAAVLLAGPTDIIDHITIEVMVDEPYLVDVGFGDSFIRPLRLNDHGVQDGLTGRFQLIPSPKGLTLTELDDGDVPAAQYRFKRVAHAMADFDPASEYLQTTEGLHWTEYPFATRLIDRGPDRVTLLADRLKVTRDGAITETPVAADRWADVLMEHFNMTVPT